MITVTAKKTPIKFDKILIGSTFRHLTLDSLYWRVDGGAIKIPDNIESKSLPSVRSFQELEGEFFYLTDELIEISNEIK